MDDAHPTPDAPPVARPDALPPTPLTSGSAVRRFGRGLVYPWRGLRFLLPRTPLWPWAALPFLFTAWLIGTAGYLALFYTDDVVALLWQRPDTSNPTGMSLWYGTVLGVGLVFFLLSSVVLWVVGNLAASPFWDVLAERTEAAILGPSDIPFDWRIALGDAFMSIRHSLLGLTLYVLVMGPLLLLHLVPGLGSAAYTALSYPVTALFVARELMDIPLSRRRTPFVDKIRWMAQHKALLAGLGTSSMLMLAIPFLNLVVMPFAVMGGTLMYCHLHRDGHGVPQRGPGPRRALSDGAATSG